MDGSRVAKIEKFWEIMYYINVYTVLAFLLTAGNGMSFTYGPKYVFALFRVLFQIICFVPVLFFKHTSF